MGEVPRDALRVRFDRAIQLEFYGAKSPPLPKRSDRASRPPSWGRTRPCHRRFRTEARDWILRFRGGVILVLGKLGDGAGRRSNGKCRIERSREE